MSRRIPLWLQAAIALPIFWQVASLLAGQTATGRQMVPSWTDIGGAFILLANYLPAGMGFKVTASGGEASYSMALLSLAFNVAVTLGRLIAGFVLGSLTGIILAAILSWSGVLRQMVALPAHLSRMLPLLALMPLFNLWFGNTETSAVLFVGLVCFCVLFANAIGAIGQVPQHYLEYAASMGANRLRIYLDVVLPAAGPRIATGLRLAHGFAWSAVVAAEFIGLQHGLGRIAFMAQEFNQMSLLALCGVLAILLALCTGAVLNLTIRQLVR